MCTQNHLCFGGVVFVASSGRIKPCLDCRKVDGNVAARAVVQRLLGAFEVELDARGGSPEDVILRLENGITAPRWPRERR